MNRRAEKEIMVCDFCSKICTFDIFEHKKECEKMPDEKRRDNIPSMPELMVNTEEQDWKDFIERKFEPHTFQARWENVICPYCLGYCRNIYHTFVCPFVPPERKRVNRKIHFWKA